MATCLVAFAGSLLAAPCAAEIARTETLRLDLPDGQASGNAMKNKRGSHSVAQLTGNAAAFVSDVSIPDGTTMTPGQNFTKTWRVKNTGSTSWSGSSLVFVTGNQLGAPAAVSVPTTAPGAIVDISVPMNAPAEAGVHRGDWQMRTADGTVFSQNIFVLITVRGNRTLAEVETDLRDHSPFVRQKAVKTLMEFGPSAAPTLIRVLKNDADADVRISAMGVLADINPLSKDAVSAILAAMGDPDPMVGAIATMVLTALTGPTSRFGPEVVPALVGALTDPNPTVQQVAIDLLASLGPAAKEAIPALRELVTRQPSNDLAKEALRVIEGR